MSFLTKKSTKWYNKYAWSQQWSLNQDKHFDHVDLLALIVINKLWPNDAMPTYIRVNIGSGNGLLH